MLPAAVGREYGKQYITLQTSMYEHAIPLMTNPTHPCMRNGPYVMFFRPVSKLGRIAARNELLDRRMKLPTNALKAVVLPTLMAPRTVTSVTVASVDHRGMSSFS